MTTFHPGIPIPLLHHDPLHCPYCHHAPFPLPFNFAPYTPTIPEWREHPLAALTGPAIPPLWPIPPHLAHQWDYPPAPAVFTAFRQESREHCPHCNAYDQEAEAEAEEAEHDASSSNGDSQASSSSSSTTLVDASAPPRCNPQAAAQTQSRTTGAPRLHEPVCSEAGVGVSGAVMPVPAQVPLSSSTMDAPDEAGGASADTAFGGGSRGVAPVLEGGEAFVADEGSDGMMSVGFN